SGNVAAANRYNFLSGFRAARLGGTEITTAATKTPVVLRFTAKCVHVIIEVRIELTNGFSVHYLRKSVQCQRRLPFPAVSLAVRPNAAGQFGYAVAITCGGQIRIAGETDAENLSGLVFDQRRARLVQRFNVAEISVAI